MICFPPSDLQRAYNVRRGGGDQDHISSFIDSSSALDEPLFGSDLLPPGHLRRFRGYRRSPGGLEEVAFLAFLVIFMLHWCLSFTCFLPCKVLAFLCFCSNFEKWNLRLCPLLGDDSPYQWPSSFFC